jgi:stage II sporulation protein GA (sporulation sigma-E factor processing peptidase)
MDLIVMVMVNKIMHYHTSLSRLLLSSTLGAIWSVIAICIPDEYRLFVNWCTYLIITGLMLMIINSPLNIIKGSSGKINWFAIRSYIKDLLKGVAVMIGIAVFLGGAIHLLVYYTYVGFIIKNIMINNRQLVIYAVVAYLMLIILVRSKEKLNRKMQIYVITVVIGDERITLKGMIDTGNQLSDYYCNKPVNVMDKKCFDKVLSKINDYSRIRYHLIPYRSVGMDTGMIEVITADYIYISNDVKTKAYKNVLIGLSEVCVSQAGEYQALINGHMMQ